jgi:type VI secretion system protein ImpF
MARTELDRSVLPSLLDRLTDTEPRSTADVALSRDASARAFRLSVQRDVEQLLNTRRTIVVVSSQFPHVRQSVHEYGVPDLSGRKMEGRDAQKRLIEDIRDTLHRFEPRLENVQVTMAEHSMASAPQVRFVVSAVLRMDPSPEQIVFDTVLETARGSFDVEDHA